MKNQTGALKAILAKLKAVTDQEQVLIAQRAFDKVAALTAQKESLLAEFDAAARELDSGEIGEQLIAELDQIRKRAEENAAALKATAQGVREARARLKKIREAEHSAGVYSADGAVMRNPDASTIVTKI